jgi:hypothetical protein
LISQNKEIVVEPSRGEMVVRFGIPPSVALSGRCTIVDTIPRKVTNFENRPWQEETMLGGDQDRFTNSCTANREPARAAKC